MDPKGTQMEPKGAEMKPQGLPKVPKNLSTIPHVCQNGRVTKPCKVPQKPKRHIQTARGRVLAKGDVDPAAGSRDEPTRLHVEGPVAERKQGFEVTSNQCLVLSLN